MDGLKLVTGLKREKNLKIKKIHRHYYEIAVCTVLMGDLSCGDAYVEGAFIFDDPNKQFITWEEFETEVDSYCDLVKLPKERGKIYCIPIKQDYNKQQKMSMKITTIILILSLITDCLF